LTIEKGGVTTIRPYGTTAFKVSSVITSYANIRASSSTKTLGEAAYPWGYLFVADKASDGGNYSTYFNGDTLFHTDGSGVTRYWLFDGTK
ncbi:MAG: hypothetical protein GXO75_15480, partial [Calditrichaeota bacterium]|nr:hypothetical protein [Calditrichota bacterium]